MTSLLDTALPLADTVLFEGYLLYPYRATDGKNAVRWQFGVLMPPSYRAVDPSESSALGTDLLIEGRARTLTVRVRFLHVRQRVVLVGGRAVPALDVGDATVLPGDDATVSETDVAVDLTPTGRPVVTAIAAPGGTTVQDLTDGDGRVAGQLSHSARPLTGELSAEVTALPGPYGVRRVRLRLVNTSDWAAGPGLEPPRVQALRAALVAAHLVVVADSGRFISHLDPPEWARGYVARCQHTGAFPVLAGPPDRADVMLVSPIVLYDHAQVAPESAVPFCDGTEMDEMLTLRAMTLTDAEKRAARGSDPRAAGIVDAVDHLPPELLDRLHGAIRSFTPRVARPAVGNEVAAFPNLAPAPDAMTLEQLVGADRSFDPDTDTVRVDGVEVGRGSAVRLRPGRTRADAQDMFLVGRAAHVEAVLHDVDGAVHLAVALDDLAEAGVNPHGRFLYFAPDEVEPIGATL